MPELARVVAVEHLGGLRLRIRFTDGLVRELDFAGSLEGGILGALNDPDEFARAQVDAAAGTVSWPNGVDLDPDVLHGDHPPSSGAAPTVLAEYRLRTTG